MKKIRQFIKDLGLFTKITIFSIFIILLVLSSAIFLVANTFSESMLQKERLLGQVAINRIQKTVTEKYNMMYNQSTLLHSNKHIGEIIANSKSNPDSLYDYKNVKFISDYLDTVCYSDSEIVDAVIVQADGTPLFSKSIKRSVYLGYDFSQLPGFQRLASSDKNIIIKYDSTTPYLINTNDSVITFISKIYNPKLFPKKTILAYFIVNYHAEVFDASNGVINESSQGELFVVSDDDIVVYSNQLKNFGAKFADISFPENAEITNLSVGVSGIRLASVVSEEAIRADTNSLISKMTLIFAISIIIILISTLLLNKYYRKKMMILATTMDNIRSDTLDVRLPVSQKDEIGRLSMAFNQMLETLDSYIKLNYKAEMARRTAEINALQAQIKPHFLFNTIESIRMAALENNAVDVAEMLTKFGNMFRWMIHFDHKIVYLEDELEYISSYLYLQKLRFGARIDFSIDAEDTILYLGIPKFTLQPVVENAIVHGLKCSREFSKIIVHAFVENQNLILRISDDGCGMDMDQLLKLREHIYGEGKLEGFGIGIRNVHRRLQLLFGDPYGVDIQSTKNSGTTVTITIPVTEKKEMEEYVSDYNN